MSTHPTRARGYSGRVGSLQQQESRLRRESSYSSSKRKGVSREDAYLYALRVAYLAYLLQPRQKRIQHVSAAPGPGTLQKKSTARTADVMKDFSLIRDSKSTKFPHAFMGALDKRLTGVLMGKERMPEYNDPLVKRTFATFLNELKNPVQRKGFEADRRVEGLVLIFFSKTTQELQKGRPPGADDSYKLMVDRHVALFLRLVSSILKDNDWSRERPELASRLQTMEKKLLLHDQNIASDSSRNGGAGGQSIEVEVPLSHELKDMPLGLIVQRMFEVPYGQVQEDINQHRGEWTEKAALQDLKTYQASLSLNSRKTLHSDSFDTEDAYESWKKSEAPEISQMMLEIMQSNMELAKMSSSAIPGLKSQVEHASRDSGYSDMSRKMSEPENNLYTIDQPVDMSGLNLGGNSREEEDSMPFTFIPSDVRACYKAVLRTALIHDIHERATSGGDGTDSKLLSKESTELLSEMALRWRIPYFSRPVLFLDVIKELYLSTEIDLDTLDAAFIYIKEPPVETKKNNRKSIMMAPEAAMDPQKWTVVDYASYRSALGAIHDGLQRDLFELMLHSYDSKKPAFDPVMYILQEHLYSDELFPKAPEDLDSYSDELERSLREKAGEVYADMLAKNVPDNAEHWEFFHVIQLGKDVVKLSDRIQKRYRKTPNIMGVSPLQILAAEVFPSFAADSRDLVQRIMDMAKERGEEIPQQDGFDLYKEMVEIRQVHSQALPSVPFTFHIEGLLQEFVWRWISETDNRMVNWVDNATKQDNFKPRTAEAELNVEEQRHSHSVFDIFQSFKQPIDQIVQLNWDDDLQYAKFMTAVSKAIGLGVAKYCDLIEREFGKEMNKPTPEQEQAASQTRQQKWMQMAKDLYANQEKVEPFQFLPESLVKLNNIEYAMQQLDKLEKEVNVDACAAVIAKHEPPVHKRERKAEKYVFTIKIIEAEDLKACDMNGLSDPYVVLGDEYQKRLYKSRVIYGNLNPRWDEAVDISTTGPLNVIATIWDWDQLGDHDCCGRTSLKLDPSHFRDFLPREYWLDLDTQGRLLLRVSMEGERDDIQFYFGKAFRNLKRTERDMTRKITDKLSAYIHYILSPQRLKGLLNKGISMQTAMSAISYFQRNKQPSAPTSNAPTQAEIDGALQPLFVYFDENFAIMQQTLTGSAMIMVMTRLWKEVLQTIEALLVPPLSDKPSSQRPLTRQEVDIVFKWLAQLFNFFHAEGDGVAQDVLMSPKYLELKSLNFFYFETTEDLIRTSESMAASTANRQQEAFRQNRMSAPPNLAPAMGGSHSFGGAAGLVGIPSRRHKTIMLSRNLGTMRKAKEEKRKQAQAEPSDDIILRILRMRPEAERYLKDRSRQKERLAAAAAAEMIVRQSLMAGAAGGRMQGLLPRR